MPLQKNLKSCVFWIFKKKRKIRIVELWQWLYFTSVLGAGESAARRAHVGATFTQQVLEGLRAAGTRRVLLATGRTHSRRQTDDRRDRQRTRGRAVETCRRRDGYRRDELASRQRSVQRTRSLFVSANDHSQFRLTDSSVVYSVPVKKSPLGFSDIFSQTVWNFWSKFYSPITRSYLR